MPWVQRMAALRVPGLPLLVVVGAGIALGTGVFRVLTEGKALFPDGVAGWSLAVLTGIIVGHLVALGRDRWWGGTGSGAALTLAILLLYGWVPAVLVSLAVVVLVGARPPAPLAAGAWCTAPSTSSASAPRRSPWPRSASVPRVEHPWEPDDWGYFALPEVVLGRLRLSAGHPHAAVVLATPAHGRPAHRRCARRWCGRAWSPSRCWASPR